MSAAAGLTASARIALADRDLATADAIVSYVVGAEREGNAGLATTLCAAAEAIERAMEELHEVSKQLQAVHKEAEQ